MRCWIVLALGSVVVLGFAKEDTTTDKFKDAFGSLKQDIVGVANGWLDQGKTQDALQKAKALYGKTTQDPKVQDATQKAKKGWNALLDQGCEVLNDALKQQCLNAKASQ